MTTPSLVDLLKAKTSEGDQELLAREEDQRQGTAGRGGRRPAPP